MYTKEYMEFVEELKRLRPTMTVKQLCEHFDMSESTMGRTLKELGLTKKSDRTDIKDEDVLADYKNGLSMNQMARKYKCSVETIQKRLNKYGKVISRSEGIRRHFDVVHDDVWNNVKADLDAGMSAENVRVKHNMGADGLARLMASHGYEYVPKKISNTVNLDDEV